MYSQFSMPWTDEKYREETGDIFHLLNWFSIVEWLSPEGNSVPSAASWMFEWLQQFGWRLTAHFTREEQRGWRFWKGILWTNKASLIQEGVYTCRSEFFEIRRCSSSDWTVNLQNNKRAPLKYYTSGPYGPFALFCAFRKQTIALCEEICIIIHWKYFASAVALQSNIVIESSSKLTMFGPKTSNRVWH